MPKSVASFATSMMSSGTMGQRGPGGGGADDDGQMKSKASRRLAKLGKAYFSTQMALTERTSIGWPALFVLWALSTIQLLVAIPLKVMREQPALKPLMQALGPISFLPAQKAEKADLRSDILFDVIASILGLGFFLHAWTVFDEFRGSRYRPAWRIRIIRGIYVVFFQAFLVSSASALVSVFSCVEGGTWLETTYSCYSGTHLGYVAASSILLPIFFPMAIVQLATMTDVAPDWSGKKNVFSAPHGRGEACAGILKLFIGLWYVFGESNDSMVLALGSLLVALTLFALYLYLLPFHHQWLNQVQCGLTAIASVASACAVFSAAIHANENSVGAVAFYFMFPLAAYAGYASAAIRWRRIGELVQRGMGVMSSPYIVELRVRWLVENARNGLRYGSSETATDIESLGKPGFGANTNNEDEAQMLAQRAAYEKMYKKKRLAGAEGDDLPDIEELRSHPSVIAADEIMRNAVITFSTSPIMRLFASHYHGFVKGNKHLERQNLLLSAQAADTSQIDVRFWCHTAMIRLSSDDEVITATSSSKMTVFKRMRFEQLQSITRQKTLKGHQLITQFWMLMCDKQPDLPKVQQLGGRIINLIDETQGMYRELTDLAPANVSVMRSYANFLLEISNDPKRGNELLVDAEQLEEENSKNTTQTDIDVVFNSPCSFDVSGENTGLMQASARMETAGQVLSMNAATLKLFGYNRREMLGRSIDILVPEPISSVHSQIVQRWITSGNESLINSGSRFLFGQHRAGHILPIKANVRSAGDIFVVVAEEVVTQTNFIIFGPDSVGWRIFAACKNSLVLFGIDVQAMKQGSVSLREYVESPKDWVGGLDTSDVKIVSVRVPSSTGSAAKSEQSEEMRIGARIQTFFARGVHHPIHILRWRVSAKVGRLRVQQHMGASHFDESKVSTSSDGDSDSDSDGNSSLTSGSDGSEAVAYQNGSPLALASAEETPSFSQPISQPLLQKVLQSGKGSPKMQSGWKKSFRGPIKPAITASTAVPASSASRSNARGVGTSQPPGKGAFKLNAAPATRTSSSEAADPIRPVNTPANGDLLNQSDTPSKSSQLQSNETASPAKETSQKSKKRRASVNISWAVHDDQGQALDRGEQNLDEKHEAVDIDKALPRKQGFEQNQSDVPSKVQKAGSVGSRGSGQSGAHSSVTQVSEMLRHSVVGSNSNLERSLVMLKRTVALVFILTGLMNIASVTVTSVLFSSTLDNIIATITNGERTIYANRIIGAMQSIVLEAEGSLKSYQPFNVSLSRLSLWADRFDALHRRTYLLQDDSMPEESRLNRDNSILVYDLIEYHDISHWENQTRYTNLVNGGFELVSRTRQTLALPLKNYLLNDTDVFWTMMNGNGGIRHGLTLGLTLANSRSESHAVAIELAGMVILICAEALILLLVVTVLIPAVVKVQKTQNRVYSSFLDTPVAIIRALRDISTRKSDIARRALSDDDMEYESMGAGIGMVDAFDNAAGIEVVGQQDGMAGGYNGDDSGTMLEEGIETAFLSLTSALQALKETNRKKMMTQQLAEDEAASYSLSKLGVWCCKRKGASVTAEKKNGKHVKEGSERKYRRNKSGIALLLVQLLWPLLVLSAYFAGAYVLTSSMVVKSRFIRAENLAIKQVQSTIGTINVNLRFMYGYCDRDFVEHHYQEYETALYGLETYYDALMLGNPAMNIRSGIRMFPQIAEIATQRGCTDTSGFYYQPGECEAFHNGLAVNGLQAMLKDWISSAQFLAHNRAEELVHNHCDKNFINSEKIKDLDDARWKFIAALLSKMGNFYLSLARSEFSQYNDMAITLTVISILGTMLFYFLMLGPLIMRMDKNIKDTRHLLLLFPDEVSKQLPSLASIGADMVKD